MFDVIFPFAAAALVALVITARAVYVFVREWREPLRIEDWIGEKDR